jgi:peptide-methionine (R)-S-oxide reductase
LKGIAAMNRRAFLLSGAGLAALGAIYTLKPRSSAAEASEFEVTYTEAQWRDKLMPDQFSVLRQEATERPFSSPLLNEKRIGNYHCAGCDLPLYASETKFDSGTGWPSFYQPLDNAVETRRDFKLLVPRTEVHCRRCGGHLGHVFNDGPQPTGLRHCINGVAMTFRERIA